MDKHRVEYILTGGAMGDTTVQANLTQKDLAALLMRDDVILLNVNKPKTAYRRKSGCKRK